MSEQGLAYVLDMTVRADKLQHTTSKEITMYYRIKNCIFDLLDVAAVESVYESGWYIIIVYKSTKHISRIQFGYLEDRDHEFNTLCDKLQQKETM